MRVEEALALPCDHCKAAGQGRRNAQLRGSRDLGSYNGLRCSNGALGTLCNFLNENLDAKLGDFAGSSIDGETPLVCYETSHEHPEMAVGL